MSPRRPAVPASTNIRAAIRSTADLPAASRRYGLATAAVLGAAAACVIHPDGLGIERRYPFAAAVAWRPHTATAALAVAAGLATRRSTRAAALAVGTVAVTGLGVVAGRRVRRRGPAVGRLPDDLTILVSNVLAGRADTGELATVIERETPDFVVLPEAGPDFRDKLMPLVSALGYRSCTSTEPGSRDLTSVALLTSSRAGDVAMRSGSGMQLRHVEATGGILGDRVLYAVHAFAPVSRPRTRRWLHDLGVVGGWTRSAVAPIVAGDFNATLDHQPLREALGRCRSSADGTGSGLVGTYPHALPRPLGIQIDHILVPVDALTSRFEIIDIAGTDHRAVLTTIRLPVASRTGQSDERRNSQGSSIAI